MAPAKSSGRSRSGIVANHPPAERPGASLANTRSKLSGLEMPLSSGRKRRQKSALVRPHSVIASHDSAPPMMAQVAMVRISATRWSLFRVSWPGAGQVVEDGRQWRGRHGEVVLVPSVVTTNPYGVSGS